jgi:AcrR family transcriptional regulator
MDSADSHTTRNRILDEAEALFAENGVEGISLRAINAAAGVSPGILHYHFGNRETLLEAIISRPMDRLMAAQQALIEPLVKDSRACSGQAIARVLVMPLADFAAEQPQRARFYIPLLARLYSDRSALLEHVSRRYSGYGMQHLSQLLQQCCVGLSAHQAELRIGFAHHLLLQGAAEWFAGPRSWQGHITGRLDAVDALIAFIAAGLLGSD